MAGPGPERAVCYNFQDMSFAVEMPVDQYSVDAGTTVPLGYTIRNEGDAEDQYEVSLEGLDPEWTAIPVPLVEVGADAHHADKLFLKPPRESESQAGNYPFVLRVRSLSTGESKVLQGVLGIKPFHYLSLEIAPKKGVVSPVRRENRFEATVMNLGNSEHSLQLFGNDPEDALTYSFSQDQVVVGPGQTKVVELVAEPLRSKPFASAQLHGFSIGARSIEAPSVVCSAQAQLEQRAWLSPGSLAFVLIVFALFLGWLALLPKPPEMEMLRLSRNEAYEGDTVVVRWHATNARRVRIRMGTEVLVDTPELFGSQEFRATASGVIEAVAVTEGRVSDPVTTSLRVVERPIVPTPEIETFSIEPKTVNKGEKLTVRYQVNDAVTKLTLSPPGELLDPKIDTIFISAEVVGTIDYTLVAENAEGKTARRSVKITVVDPTLPRVDELRSNPSQIDAESGTVTLVWRTANATRVELFMGGEKIEPVELSGSRDFPLTGSVEFVLNAYDDENRKATKKVRVEVRPTPVVDPNKPSGNPGGGSTAGGRG